MSGFWNVCSFLCTQYLVGPPFALITASMRRGTEAISLWHCSGVMKAQVALITAFRSSALLGLMSLIFLLTIWQCGQVPSPAGKWNQHLHKTCQQKEAWSSLKLPGVDCGLQKTQWTNTSRWHSSPFPSPNILLLFVFKIASWSVFFFLRNSVLCIWLSNERHKTSI